MKMLLREPGTFPLGFDKNPEKVDSNNHGKNYIGDMIVDMRNMVKEGGEKVYKL